MKKVSDACGCLGRQLLACVLGLATPVLLSGQEVSFRDEVRPLLAKFCLACHGPDAGQREADLRLDLEDDVKSRVVIAGDSANSELILRIQSTVPEEQMPPPETGHALSEAEKETLRRWIDSGAEWERHWAFEPVQAPEVPLVPSTWPESEIDAFVLSRMLNQGLSPAPPADQRVLIRRVYLDLIGVPPSPQEVDAFLADLSPTAYETVVDRLLASPHYGEQMAVSWLDVARFADTNGYQNDFYRSMWPYRDWVIEAFNSNLPYDQFILQQLAGDLLPNPSQSQLIATGFNRNNRSVTEGGSIEEEWRIENAIDRVETTSAAFLGLTLGCARCHDHKYDPISQREFYQFFAFFNNVDEKGVYTETRGNVPPLLKVPTPAQLAEAAELQARIAALQAQISPDQARWEALVGEWRSEGTADDERIWPEVVYELPSSPEGMELGEGPVGTAIRLNGKQDQFPGVDLAGFEIERDRAFAWSAWLHGDARGSVFGKMDESVSYRGVDGIVLQDGKLKVHLIHDWKANALAVISKDRLPAGEWAWVTVTYDGSSRASGYRVYFDGEPVAVDIDVDNLTGSVRIDQPFKIGQRNRSEHFSGLLSAFRLYAGELTPGQVKSLHRRSLLQELDALSQTRAEVTELGEPLKRYLSRLVDRPLVLQLNRLETELQQSISRQQTTMIMRDRGEYRPTFLLRRGQYDQPDQSEELWPAVPEMLPPLSTEQPANRLGLARWMVDERNPLVSRVAINRAWLKFFGRGLVETVDNFGVQGTPPSHPQLLDWLAADFRRSGWDLKRLHKAIVMSATYRQASEWSPDKLERDPGNRWHARGPRYRLSAEQIRDYALSVSGLLVESLGGPSVKPYQPEGLWEELAGGANDGPYQVDEGEGRYRRSLYTYRKRTVSHPVLATWDAPSWEVCQLKRGRTNTPLQALALLNDVTYVEAARKLAERMLKEGDGDVEKCIASGFEMATLRPASESELAVLTEGFESYHTFYKANPEEASALLAIGVSPTTADWPSETLAAMTSVASVILNLDEVITKE